MRLDVLDAPTLPPTGAAPGLSGGVPVTELLTLEKGESVVGLARLDDDAPPLVLATAHGVVKRVGGDRPGNKDSWDVIALRDGDAVVGAGHAADPDKLVLVSSDAQLLRFDATAVRPQGRSGQGISGIRLADGASVIYLAVVPDAEVSASVVVTVAGSSEALPGTVPGSAKVTPLDRYPAKGRATGGVRAQRFVRGEDCLQLAWVGPEPARAVGSGGQSVELPELDERRDGSGQPLPAPIAAIG